MYQIWSKSDNCRLIYGDIWSVWRPDIAKSDIQYGIRPPSRIWKISIFFVKFHAWNENLYLCTKFVWNRIIHGWDMEIRLFSKWRPTSILNLRTLQLWSCVLYLYVILYFRSKFRINRSIWRRDIAKKRFSIWRPSAILNLQNFDFLVKFQHGNWNVHQPTKFDRNRVICGSDMEIMLFSKWWPSAILNLRKLQFWSRHLYRHVIFHICSKFRVHRPICRRDIAKKGFQYGVRPPSFKCYDVVITVQHVSA